MLSVEMSMCAGDQLSRCILRPLGPAQPGACGVLAPPFSPLLRCRLWHPWQAYLREVSVLSPQRSPQPGGGHHPSGQDSQVRIW